ncbi:MULTISPECIES: heme-binding protein [Thiomicrorhabdus]|uniref:Heme-binding protein n=1 Tax=Thiomicrorhabdus xiamenensis TaxID=2739063 RepID=A0A7D4NQ73_9GAMM|nr:MULTISPECIES: heme-binding protein [Thiomicrorhabdus]MBO1923802.1 heme-binding protein [Thiomicrorhabdus sp. 6S3-12]QKI88597.1 heme-binding protein [Thiomicrorhabdus xiamenensis]
MLKKLFAGAVLSMGVLSTAMPVQAEEPMVVNVSILSLDMANKAAMATIEACREKGIPVSVTVVDRSGIVQAQLRDTIAPAVSLGISQKKAYTAVMFNVKGSQLGERAKSPLQTMGAGLAFMAGSTPIQAGGKLYGAIGVSGAPDGMDDEACAIKGAESILEDLEMM